MVEIREHIFPEQAVSALNTAREVCNEKFNAEFWATQPNSQALILQDTGYVRDLRQVFVDADKALPHSLISDIAALQHRDHIVVVKNIPENEGAFVAKKQMPPQKPDPVENFIINYLMTHAITELKEQSLEYIMQFGTGVRFFNVVNSGTSPQRMHHDFSLREAPYLCALHTLSPGEKPCATRFWDLTTTALHNREIADLLLKKGNIDLNQDRPRDWSYFLKNYGYQDFIDQLGRAKTEDYTQKEFTGSDKQNSLALLKKGSVVLFNDARLLHGRASHQVTSEIFPDEVSRIAEAGQKRTLLHYATQFSAGHNHLAGLRLHTLQTGKQL